MAEGDETCSETQIYPGTDGSEELVPVPVRGENEKIKFVWLWLELIF